MIELKHIRKEYPEGTPLTDVNAVIHEGDVISVIGHSGCGKSTLLRCINLLDPPSSGQIIVDGEDITVPGFDLKRVRQKMGMVFQSFNLFEHLTVIENVMAAPIDLLRIPKQEAYDQGMRLLRQVGLADRALRYPDELSGGQKQRAAIARALAMKPEILLFDEPTSALDPTMVGEVLAVIRELSKAGKTMMVVTHEMKFAREICNRVFYIDEGRIYEEGGPDEIFLHPQKEKTRRFIHQLKVLELAIDSKNFDFVGTIGSLEEYCYKNQIPSSAARRIHSVIEELCAQILLHEIPAEPKIRAAIEFTESTGKVELSIRYNGPRFSLEDSSNELSLQIIRNCTESIQYSFHEEEAEYPNLLRILLKEG